MKLRLYLSTAVMLAAVPAAMAQLPPLPAPLVLPPGLVETLPINHDSSYMAESVRIADCPLATDEPFGTCGNVLFGGFALQASQLSGNVQVQFYAPQEGIAHFEITHPGNLTGDDAPMVAPQLYTFPTQQNYVFDAFQQVSSGDLNLNTGEVTNLILGLNMFNTFYQAFGNVNPRFFLGYFQFPGAYGSAWIQFAQRTDGLLDMTLHATTFLPLGYSIDGAVPRIPMPFCGQDNYCASIQAPGSSFRPSINYTTVPTPASAQVPCAPKCIDVPYNSVQVYTNHTFYTFFHEGFTMDIPEIGGVGIGRTHFDGRTVIQFGQATGDLVPVFFELLTPSGTLGVAPTLANNLDFLDIWTSAGPLPQPAGITVGFIGKDIVLHTPLLTYHPLQMSYSTDPFDGSRGLYNVKTGQFVDQLLFSGYLLHSLLLDVLYINNGRIPETPFLTRGPAYFDLGPNGESMFHLAAAGYRNYTGFFFPAPDLIAADAWVAGQGSRLDPHLNIQAVQTAATDVPGPSLKAGSYNVTTPTGDAVTMSYSVPCNAEATNANGTFTYSNEGQIDPNSGRLLRQGTFTMQNLISVTCTNSAISTAAPGDYDTIAFSGIGIWSNDPQQLDPHVASVTVYPNSPQGPYFSVLIDGGYLSNADLKPPVEPIP
jgi:hypothetical protein